MTSIPHVKFPLIEEVEFRMVASKPLYYHPRRTAYIRVLGEVRVETAKLGMVGGFTTTFAASLGLLTTASQAEVFAAAAA